MEQIKVLVCEDEAIVAKDIERFIKGIGHNVVGIAANGKDALEISRRENPDVAIMDINLQGKASGIDVARHLVKELNIPSVYLTAHRNESLLKLAKKTMPLGYLLKPFREAELKMAVEVGLERHNRELNTFKNFQSRIDSLKNEMEKTKQSTSDPLVNNSSVSAAKPGSKGKLGDILNEAISRLPINLENSASIKILDQFDSGLEVSKPNEVSEPLSIVLEELREENSPNLEVRVNAWRVYENAPEIHNKTALPGWFSVVEITAVDRGRGEKEDLHGKWSKSSKIKKASQLLEQKSGWIITDKNGGSHPKIRCFFAGE